jgi:hypothetical protein
MEMFLSGGLTPVFKYERLPLSKVATLEISFKPDATLANKPCRLSLRSSAPLAAAAVQH